MDVEGALELLGCLAAWRQFEDPRSKLGSGEPGLIEAIMIDTAATLAANCCAWRATHSEFGRRIRPMGERTRHMMLRLDFQAESPGLALVR